jgi:2-polyprenyl-3-methyl-5-hydroxy-6-metoxy-1,4-benzoquinol methylase
MKKYKDVHLNEYGYYELDVIPTVEERRKVFEEEYFQDSMSIYEQSYEEEELRYFENKLIQKEMMILKNYDGKPKDFLDIGCGESFALAYFHKKGYNVQGIDFSEYGIKKHNPKMREYLLQGDSEEILPKLIEEGRKFDIINMDEVMEMMIHPRHILELCKQVLRDDGILLIGVANDYSILQEKLLEEGKLKDTYWLDNPGHPSYFNKDGLIRLLENCGYQKIDFYGESFIDLNLLNDRTNYYEHKEVGKDCYWSKVELENLMHDLSPEKTLEVFALLGEMGLGRQMIGLFRKKIE